MITSKLDLAMSHAHTAVHYLIEAADMYKEDYEKLFAIIKTLNEAIDKMDEFDERKKEGESE